MSNIVRDFKKNLQGSDLDSVREFALEAKKQGFTISNLTAPIRLHIFYKIGGSSGAN